MQARAKNEWRETKKWKTFFTSIEWKKTYGFKVVGGAVGQCDFKKGLSFTLIQNLLTKGWETKPKEWVQKAHT